MSFSALQLYIPLCGKVNLSMPDLSAFLSFINLLSMRNLYMGVGFPWALHVIVIRSPSLTVSWGASVVTLVSLGESEINKTKRLYNYHI